MQKILIALFCFLFSLSAQSKTILNWGIRSDLVYFKKSANDIKKEIAEKTKGEIEINIISYPEEDETSLIATDWIKNGRYDIVQEITGKLDTLNGEFKIWSLPFLFKSDSHVEKYINTLGQEVLKKSETKELLPIDYSFSGGFLMITGEKLESFSQLTGKSLVIEEGFGYFNSSISKLGVKLLTERDYSKSTNTFMEHIIAVADEITLNHEIDKINANITNHRVISRVIFANNEKVKKLSKSNQAILTSSLKKFAKIERADSIEGKKLILKLLKNRGAKINSWNHKSIEASKKFFITQYREFEETNPKVVSAIEKLEK